MQMTHYMELLATNQPWNLLTFMAVPVILAETVAITELYLLYTRNFKSWVGALNRAAGIAGGLYFMGVFIYLIHAAVLPLTATHAWRGPLDIIAVGFYLLGVFPLVGLAVLDLKLLGKKWSEKKRLAAHATCVGVFLVVAHIAMIAGMANPTLWGYQPEPRPATMQMDPNVMDMDMSHPM